MKWQPGCKRAIAFMSKNFTLILNPMSGKRHDSSDDTINIVTVDEAAHYPYYG